MKLTVSRLFFTLLLSGFAMGLGAQAQMVTTLMQDKFTYTTTNINGHAPTSGGGTWNVNNYSDPTSIISANGSQATMTMGGGTIGAGQAIANWAFTPQANTIYTLQITYNYTGPIGTGHDCWAGFGFSNATNGGGQTGNAGPWMFIRPQTTSTNAPGVAGYHGTTVSGSGTAPASDFSQPVTAVIVWNTGTGAIQYYIDDVYQSSWNVTTTLPTGSYNAYFQAFQTGSCVNVTNITLTAMSQVYSGNLGIPMKDIFNYTASTINGHAPGAGGGTWSVVNYSQPTSIISANGSQASISTLGGTLGGGGQAIANWALTPGGDTYYSLNVTFKFTGPIGAGHDCWGGMGFSNATNGGGQAGNAGPWLLIRPQGVSTDNPQIAAFAGPTSEFNGSVPAACYTGGLITATITWNTMTGQAQYFVNGALQGTYTTPLPDSGDSYNVYFHGYQTGNTVDVTNVTLFSQTFPAVLTSVQFYPAPGHEADMVGGQIIGSNSTSVPEVLGGNGTILPLDLYDLSSPGMDDFTTLATITTTPTANTWNTINLPNNTKPYRWIGYLASPTSYCYIGDMDFYSGTAQLINAGSSEFSSFPNTSTTDRIATDGNPGSIFWAYNQGGGYFGLDTYLLCANRWPNISPAASEQVLGPATIPVLTYPSPQTITLFPPAPGVTIKYTLDGTPPTSLHGTTYTAPFSISQTTTVRAVSTGNGLADGPEMQSTYILTPVDKPQRYSIHFGNSLTQVAGDFDRHAATAGDPHTMTTFGIGGAWTSDLWNAANNISNAGHQTGDSTSTSPSYPYPAGWNATELAAWNAVWASITSHGIQTQLSDMTLQPRDFFNNNEDDEAMYDLDWLNYIQGYSPNVQPWLYSEWTEFARQRPTDLGTQHTYEMTNPLPAALTWEESMGAMELYNEDVLTKVNMTYTGAKAIKIIPASIAMGWFHNMIQHGTFPLTPTTLAPGDFYTQFFRDQVHTNDNGSFLTEMVWYSAFYGQSPVGRVLPRETSLTSAQATAMEQLAWSTVSNYPPAGIFVEGTTSVAAPTFSPTGHVTVNTPITLASTTAGAWFRYTLDGTVPTRNKGYVYCGVITVRPGMTVKAIAFETNMADSAVSTTTY